MNIPMLRAPRVRLGGLAASLALSLLLSACGGGDGATTATTAVGNTPENRAVSTAVVAVTPATRVVSLTKVSETRVSRTVYDYVFQVTVGAGSVPLSKVIATLTAAGTGTTIVDGVVQTGAIPANGQVTPTTDTIRLRHDRTYAFNQAALQWSIDATPVVPTGTLALKVLEAGGATVPGAQVSVVGATGVGGVTASDGTLQLDKVPAGTEVVLQVRRAGYVTQAVRVTATEGQSLPLTVRMLAASQQLLLSTIEAPQLIAANESGASIQLPAQAFVTASGAPATGPARVVISPWQVDGTDLTAMLGNGRARAANGALVELISAGMLSVEFTDAAGNPLQLAAGKKAVIEMDLPSGLTQLNGVDLTDGSTIPMWHFDEAQGLWIEEGLGTVSFSRTGLKLHAEVGHFSTWNWDFKFEGGSSINVQCVNASNLPVACAVEAEVLLDGGGRLVKSAAIPAAGASIIRMPNSALINWTADANGFRGAVSARVFEGNVVIHVDGTVRTHNFVQCARGDGTALPCTVRGDYALADGSSGILETAVPAGGAYIDTGYNSSAIHWTASANEITPTSVTLYEAVADTGPTAAVNLALAPTTVFTAREIPTTCANTGTSGFNVPPEPLTQCRVTLRVYSNMERLLWNLDITIPTGTPTMITVPLITELDTFASAEASATGPSGFTYFSFAPFDLGTTSLDFSFQMNIATLN